MRLTILAAFLLVVPGVVPGQDQATADRPSLEELLARMEKGQQEVRSLQARLELTIALPEVVGQEGKQPAELRAVMRVASMRGDKGELSRLDVDMQTPQGPLRSEKVRTPEGIWIHQASELIGERWLKVDRETMEKLDRAYEVMGAGGPLQQGTSRVGSVLGAEMLRGLLPSYDVTIGEDAKVEGADCWQVVAKLKKDAEREAQGSLPRERPDEVRALVDKSTLFLRRLVQTQAGTPQLTVDVRQLALNPKLDDPALFDLEKRELPEGGKWADVMQDPLASVRIREDLKRLEEIEKERAKAKEASGDKPGEKPPEQKPPEEKPPAEAKK